MKSLKQKIMDRDGISSGQADQLIQEARDHLFELIENEDQEAHYICETHFGLEPDYLEELIY